MSHNTNKPLTLEEIYEFEFWLEETFKAYLSDVAGVNGTSWYMSRETSTAKSPRGEVKFTMGAAQNHRHIFPDGIRWVIDGFAGSLEVTLVTNRVKDDPRRHSRMKGLTRSRLQMFTIIPVWDKYSSKGVLLLVDIREAGTQDSEDDENNLDESKIKWNVYFNINPAVWPQGA